MCPKFGGVPGVCNAQPLGSTKFANSLPPGTDKAGKCPTVAQGGGGWVQLELTDT